MRSLPADRLAVELRIDPAAPPGDLTGALASLVLGRARQAVAARLAHRPGPPGQPDVTLSLVKDDAGQSEDLK